MTTIRMLKAGAICVFVLLASASATVGQGLITDRPDFTESGVVVPTGTIQLEAGATLERFSSSGNAEIDRATFGEALIRWWVLKRLELRFESPNYNRISSGSTTTTGFDDIRIGVKYQIGPFGEAGDFDLGVIGKFSIPTGDDDIGNNSVVPEFILSASKLLGQDISLGGQVFASLPAGDDGRSFDWGATLVGAATVGPVGVFVEFFVEIPEEGTAPMMAHAGILLPVSLKFQLDIHGGMGLSDTAPNYFVGGGFSVAF